ncbi:MAG TPA: rod shape-determining protein MreC [Vicinamibacterales bacterium]
MARLETRSRAGYLLLAAIVGHVLLISAQVNSKSGVPILEAVTFGVFAELERGTAAVTGSVRHSWSDYVGLRQARAENETLKRQLADAQIQLQEQRALADRTRSLAQMLELREGLELKTTAAEIIGAGSTPDFRTVTIDKGQRQGLATDMAVIAPAGVVGRIVVPGVLASKVQLLIDRNAAAAALVARSRAQGLVAGTGEMRFRMEYVPTVSDIVVGDTVVTSGLDGIYPKGLVIGRIDSIDKTGSAWQIGIVPAVDFSSLEQVLVVLSSPTSTNDAPPQGARP